MRRSGFLQIAGLFWAIFVGATVALEVYALAAALLTYMLALLTGEIIEVIESDDEENDESEE